jgi:hypothetical protein
MMFKLTKDLVYLLIILLLVLTITIEFRLFVHHYEYLVGILKLMHKFKTEPKDLVLALNFIF